MRSILTIVALLVSVSSVAPAQEPPDGTVTARRFPRYPVMVIQNETMNAVRVFDQGFQIATVLPGESVVTVVPGVGARRLTIRTLGSETQTEMETFESNRSWRLTIDYDGRNWLALRP